MFNQKKSCKKCGIQQPYKNFYKSKGYVQNVCKACQSKNVQNNQKNAYKHRANNILIIPDTHAPYHHPDTVAFLKAVADRYNPKQVIHLGDEVDNHAMSFHDTDPDLDNAGAELAKAREFIAELSKAFPKMVLMDSNHGSLLYRRGKAKGIPRAALVPYRELLGAPEGWEWHFEYMVDDILFCHGDGKRGDALSAARYNFGSIVMGHHHSEFGIRWQAVQGNRMVFGMNAGCLIDDQSLAFGYNKKTSKRPVLGCGLLVNGNPILLPMKVDDNNRWIGEL